MTFRYFKLNLESSRNLTDIQYQFFLQFEGNVRSNREYKVPSVRRVENGFQTRDKLPRILQEREHLAWWHFLIKMPSVSTFFLQVIESKELRMFDETLLSPRRRMNACLILDSFPQSPFKIRISRKVDSNRFVHLSVYSVAICNAKENFTRWVAF